MILAALGKLSVAQDLTAGATDSTNVIQLPAEDYVGFSDLWWVVDTETAPGGAGSLKFALVVATAANLTTNIEVCSVTLAAITDVRAATIGRHIVALDVGKMLVNMLDTDGSSYPFIGMICTLGGSATISINASLSPTEPRTEPHRMVVTSPVGVPDIASAGSGF